MDLAPSAVLLKGDGVVEGEEPLLTRMLKAQTQGQVQLPGVASALVVVFVLYTAFCLL